MDTLKTIEWASDTIRNRLEFGMGDSKEAAYARERRSLGALNDSKREIIKLRNCLKLIVSQGGTDVIENNQMINVAEKVLKQVEQ